jgi:galacturan 1,4-alpha-galacturonidase
MSSSRILASSIRRSGTSESAHAAALSGADQYSFVYQSNDVKYQNIQIRSISNNASAPAANSDGWDIYRSSNIVIRNSNVQNGDDWCVFLLVFRMIEPG